MHEWIVPCQIIECLKTFKPIANPSSTDINLFAAEMKYLHDNNFKVLPISDLRYDQSTNLMYIK